MAEFNVSNDPEALLKRLSADREKVAAFGNAAPEIDYSAYVNRNRGTGMALTAPMGAGTVTAGADYEAGVPSATVKTKQNVGFGDLSGSVKKLMNHQAEMKARLDVPLDRGSAFVQGQRDESGNTFGAGMQRPFMGGNLSAGVNRNPYGTQGNIQYNRSFAHGGLASLRHNADAVTAQGRHGDDTLLHVSKKELAGLAKLLGRPLTTNPHTGLQEAFGLKNILPTAAAALATYLTGGAASPLMAAAIAGGASAGTSLIMGAKPRDALTQGLIAGGSAGILQGLAGPAETAAGVTPDKLVPTNASQLGIKLSAPSTTPVMGSNPIVGNLIPAPVAGPALVPPVNPLGPLANVNPDITGVTETLLKAPNEQLAPAGSGLTTYGEPYNLGPRGFSEINRTPTDAMLGKNAYSPSGSPPAAPPAAPLTNSEQFSQRFDRIKENFDKPGKLMDAVKSPYGAMLGYGIYREATRPTEYKEPEERKSNYEALEPYERKVQFPGSYNRNAEFNYFPGDRYARAAEGGLMSDISMAHGGIASFDKGGAATAIRNIRRMYKTREEAVRAGVDPRMLDYAFGKGEIIGRGDGMSDNVPAQIDGGQEARLSDGEFVIPADVVSGLGNGSTKAGSDHLYKLLDRVRQERTGTKKQGKQIKADNLLPA